MPVKMAYLKLNCNWYMSKLAKFYLLLLLAILIAGSIFITQFLRARTITVKPVDIPLISEGYYNIPIEDNDPVLGNPGSPLTVVLFSDLACKKCRQSYDEISKFVKIHPQDVRLFLKFGQSKNMFFKTDDLPQRAAFCAGKQNKFWDYLDLLNTEDNQNEQTLKKIADNLKLDSTSWWNCANSSDAQQKIARSITLTQSLGIDQWPIIYVNNKKINLQNDISITDMLTQFIVK